MEDTLIDTTISNQKKLLLQPDFKATISALRNLKIDLPKIPIREEIQTDTGTSPISNARLFPIEVSLKSQVNAKNGEMNAHRLTGLVAYDEAINKYSALEGTAFFTSHSLIITTPSHYIPINMLTFYFYTRSQELHVKSDYIKQSDDVKMQSQIDYVNDKIDFILKYAPDNSILFIDGPLIAGDVYVRIIGAMDKFHEKNIIPIFFVKNTNSNLVTDNIKELSGKFNSDLHWAHQLLDQGERTCLFKYSDTNNPKNSKIFCYFKAMNISPIRIEFHIDTFEKYKDKILSIIDLIYYLILVQGDTRNPQIRLIAIAEKFARDTLDLVDFGKIMKTSGVVPTMNQERFGW